VKERTLLERAFRATQLLIAYAKTGSEEQEMLEKLINMLSRIDPNARDRVHIYQGDRVSHIRNQEDLYITLLTPEGYFYPVSTLNHIAIHLYALSITPERGHTPAFYKTQAALTRIALELGIAYPLCDKETGIIPPHIKRMMFSIV
jgi:hypothetical protein